MGKEYVTEILLIFKITLELYTVKAEFKFGVFFHNKELHDEKLAANSNSSVILIEQ